MFEERKHWQTNQELRTADRVRELNTRFGSLEGEELMAAVAAHFEGRLCLVSSFGAESALLLHLVAQAAPATPVLFLDTRKLFPETLAYRDRLTTAFGLEDVRTIGPTGDHIQADDPEGILHSTNPSLCCHIRKRLPLLRALKPFDGWITGRKRYQGETRASLEVFEGQDGKIKINPLAHWPEERVAKELEERDLPPHPLVANGYPSIGCTPCTTPVKAGEDPRAGRWRGQEKTECGIHFSKDDGLTRLSTARR